MYTRAYSAFTDEGKFCGVITVGVVARHFCSGLGLCQGEAVDINRIALNGEQPNISQIMAVVLKRIRDDLPCAKIVISYADTGAGHCGIVYQACNFIYLGRRKGCAEYMSPDGVRINQRTLTSMPKGMRTHYTAIPGTDKFLYAYPLVKRWRRILLERATGLHPPKSVTDDT